MRDGEFLKHVGGKVKAARISKGITVRALGELCKMDYSNLSRFENGQHGINVLTLKRISEQLNVEIKDLL